MVKYLKITVFIIMAFLAAVPVGAQQRRTVGVVLSGGGAKGVAHIPALRAIERAGIPIDYIAGTSMGAIIGGLYSIGYSTRTLDSMVRTQDWNALVYERTMSRSDLSFAAKENDEKYVLTVPLTANRRLDLTTGFIGGYNVYNLLYELTYGYHDSLSFDQLPIPFACIGYDMVTGRPITLDHGSLPEAIRASMSIPGAFEAVRTGGMVLVDGGLGNNFPVDVVRAMGADIVIGIDVGAPLRDADQLNSLSDIVEQISGFAGQALYEKNVASVDLYIHPDITGFSAASFSPAAIDTLLQRGETAAMARWSDLVELRDSIGLPDGFEPRTIAEPELHRTIAIGTISFEGLGTGNETALRRIAGIREHSRATGVQLNRAVARLKGTGTLDDVHYRLDGDAPHSLVFVVREKTRNSISFGFRFDSEEMAAVLLNISLAGKNMTNSNFDITGRLGTNPYVKAAYIIGNETQRRFSLSYMFRYNDLSLYRRGERITNLDFDHHMASVDFSNIRVRNLRASVGAEFDLYDYQTMIGRDRIEEDVRSLGLTSYYARLYFESLDSRYYPRRGMSVAAGYALTTDDFFRYQGRTPFGTLRLDALSAVSVSRRVTFIPGLFGRVLTGKRVAWQAGNFMGGAIDGRYMPQQFAFVGIHHFEAFDNALVGARLDMRVRMWRRSYASLKLNYVRHHDDFFRLVDQGAEVLGMGVNYSYNSIIGPIDLLVDWSNRDKKVGVFFNLGYYF